MGRRLSTGTDPYGPLADERYEREPPVPDGIKITGTLIEGILVTAEAVGVDDQRVIDIRTTPRVVEDGERIVQLLGAPRDGGLPEWNHPVAGQDRRELRQLLDELLAGIEEHVDSEEGVRELLDDGHPRDRTSVEPTDEVFLRVYGKALAMRRLLDFAIEHDVDLAIQ